jgi:transcriptional regulator with XRE-family HTH domain
MKRQKSLRQQARELEISPSYLSMILSGQRQPNPQLRDKLCSLGMLTSEADLSLRGRCPRPLDECATLAGDPGFEPGLTDPESVVLPLD